jgi:hypothetical protein
MKLSRITLAVVASVLAVSSVSAYCMYRMFKDYDEARAREELKPLLGVAYGNQQTSPRVIR